jgi:branched-subunit amino acid transport protein
MSDLMLILMAAVITYSSRVVFLIWQRPAPGGAMGRFLEVFPLALFLALATAGLGSPNGSPEVTPALGAVVGGIAGAALFKRSLVGVMVVGGLAYAGARAWWG